MTNKEAVERIKDHVRVHKIGEYPHVHLAEALNLAITALESPRYDWTPCAEGLPTIEDEYAVTVRRLHETFNRRKTILWTKRNLGYFHWEGSPFETVIAWQPLPEPYNPDQFREPTEMMQEDAE